MRRSKLQYVRGVDGLGIVYPTDGKGGSGALADSCVRNWAYGEILFVIAETSPTAVSTVIIRDEADTKTLAVVGVNSGAGSNLTHAVRIPIYEPWGLMVDNTSLTVGVVFQPMDYS